VDLGRPEPRLPDAVDNPVVVREFAPRVRLLRALLPASTHDERFDRSGDELGPEIPIPIRSVEVESVIQPTSGIQRPSDRN
jgi:hypothetical protein